MRSIVTCLLIFLSVIVKAQTVDGLNQDMRGRYSFTHTSAVMDASKSLLYQRLKPFVVNDLNASDTYLRWDEAGRDSIATVAFFELPNSEEIRNQVVDCKAKLSFVDGAATLTLTGFNYSALVNNVAYAEPMHRMGKLPYFAQSYAKLALAETLRLLAERMDKMAMGVKPQLVKRKSTKPRKPAETRAPSPSLMRP
jgi:hypothetical protein